MASISYKAIDLRNYTKSYKVKGDEVIHNPARFFAAFGPSHESEASESVST